MLELVELNLGNIALPFAKMANYGKFSCFDVDLDGEGLFCHLGTDVLAILAAASASAIAIACLACSSRSRISC